MKIGIDARMLGPKQGGLGRYIEQLIIRLEQIDTQNNYVIFLRTENWHDYVPKNSNFKKIKADIPWYGFQEQLLFPILIKKQKIDLMHFPHWNVPLCYYGDFIVTIHDLLLWQFPTRKASTLAPICYWLKNKIFRLTIKKSAQKAKKIITVSEFSAQDIIKNLHVPKEKISVIYLSPLPPIKNSEPPFSLREKYNIHKPYWLYVGVAYPHKNLETLIDAWKIFSEKNNDEYQLVLVGKENYFYHQLRTYIKKNNVHNVILTGFVPDTELGELYKNATLYVFPSLYEGFGLPPLEAMQYDLPVISSNSSCLPEILKDAALYFNAKNTQDIIGAATTIIKNEKIRKMIIENGRKLLQKYSWDKTAIQTLQIYSSTTKKVDN